MPVQVSRQHQSQPHHANHSTTSLTSNPNTSTYSLHRDSPTSSRDDASSTTSSISIGKGAMAMGERRGDGVQWVLGEERADNAALASADGRQRKRLHMNPESSNLPRNTALREPRSPSKPTTRPGVRDPKRPLVTRAPDFSNLKSYVKSRFLLLRFLHAGE